MGSHLARLLTPQLNMQELGPEWTLMKAGTPGCPDMEDWLADNLPDGGRVGIDPYVHTVDAARKLEAKLTPAGKVGLSGEGSLPTPCTCWQATSRLGGPCGKGMGGQAVGCFAGKAQVSGLVFGGFKGKAKVGKLWEAWRGHGRAEGTTEAPNCIFPRGGRLLKPGNSLSDRV